MTPTIPIKRGPGRPRKGEPRPENSRAPRTVAEGSPTPLSDYLAKHCVTIHAVAKRLRLHEVPVKHHAFGQVCPSLAVAFIYQEQLGIDARLWAQVPVVREAIEERRRGPDVLRKKQRDYMRRRYQNDPEFNARVKAINKREQQRKIQMVKEGKAYYSTSPAGNPMILVKPEFKVRRRAA